MEEMVIEERPRFFSKLFDLFTREEETDDIALAIAKERPRGKKYREHSRYLVTVRRNIGSIDEAIDAADGLKRGEQQILNLSSTDESTRQKIVDFMCGVNYAQEGTWEEIGQHIFLIVPSNADVEVAPSSGRGGALRN